MKITPTALSIAQLLSTQSEEFVVPAYQRRYSWQAKHIRELFDDINQLESGETHLLGSIVCLTNSHTAGVNELELVDGQQRMTTIMLYLNAIRQRLDADGNDEDSRLVGSYLHCKSYDGTLMNKLVLGELDDKDFSRVMDNRGMDEVVNHNLAEAFALITQLIHELTPEAFNALRYKFINQANVIRLDVAEAKDAFKLFETINNRGLSLSPADIIKNFLLGNASLIDNKTLQDVKDDWTQLVIALDMINMDDFFRQYTIIRIGRKVPQSQLIDTFKRYYARNVVEGQRLSDFAEYQDTGHGTQPKQHITDFAHDLRQAAQIYRQIIQASTGDIKIDRHLRNLRLIRSFVSYTFVLNLLRRNVSRDDKLDILAMLETFILRRNVAEYRTNELEDIFARLTRLTDENLAAKVYKILRDNLPGDSEFRDKLLKQDFKGQLENRAKYILEQIEYQITGGTGEKYIAGGEEVHLEHIMPQTIATKKSMQEYGDWQHYIGIENLALHGEYLAKLGNLTLLGAPLNIHASNNPFKAKQKGGIEESGKGKETDYSKSNIELTKQLLGYDEWKFEQIEARGKELADMAVGIWSLPEYEVPADDASMQQLRDGLPVSCEQQDITANGIWLDDGRLRVLAGSLAMIANRSSFGTHPYKLLKERLLADSILRPQGDTLIFSTDYQFDNPSAAAACVLGRSANGKTEWRDESGRTLNQIEAAR